MTESTSAELAALLSEPEPTTAPDPYDSIAALNWSSLKLIHTSPKLFKYRLTHPQPEKREFELGLACHCAILEPEKFDDRYGVYNGTHDKRHNAFKEWFKENPGLSPLKQKEHDTAHWVRDAVYACRDARDLLTGGLCEETLTWTNELGIECKARLDYLRPDVVVDLKTTVDIDPRRFSSSAARYLYHGQMGFYHDGAFAAHRLPQMAQFPYIIAVEKEPPFDTGVFELGVADLEAGRALNRSLLTRYTECLAADWWPGKVPSKVRLDLPEWAAKGQAEEEF